MVSNITITTLLIGGIICFLLPILSFIYIRKKSPKLSGPLIAGVLAFYVFQMIIRIPILQALLPMYSWYQNMPLLTSVIFLGGTAALFETAGRFITIKYILKDRQSYYSGIAHGIGHGGIEAILLVGINYLVYIYFGAMINNGTFDSLLVGQEELIITQFEYIRTFLINVETLPIFLAIAERIMVFIIQIGLSLLVMEGIIFKKTKLILFAFLTHMALDTLAGILMVNNINIYIIEGIILLFAGLSLYYIKTSKKRFKNNIISKEESEEHLKSDY